VRGSRRRGEKGVDDARLARERKGRGRDSNGAGRRWLEHTWTRTRNLTQKPAPALDYYLRGNPLLTLNLLGLFAAGLASM